MGFIYKICCNDNKVTDFYIGSTTDLMRRTSQHKYNVLTGKETNRKLYKTIRNNGFWNNWNIEILATVNTNDIKHLRRVEQLYLNNFNPNLNIIKKCC
jgi:group I intron endonuclease